MPDTKKYTWSPKDIYTPPKNAVKSVGHGDAANIKDFAVRENAHSQEQTSGKDNGIPVLRRRARTVKQDGPEPVDVHVGRKIRLRRQIIGMSQQTLASAANCTFQQIQKYERGGNRVSASRLYDIALALQVPMTYFFEGLPDDIVDERRRRIELTIGVPQSLRGGAPATCESDDPCRSTDALEILHAYFRLNSDERRAVKDFLTAAAEIPNRDRNDDPGDFGDGAAGC